ncbi:glycosyl transferase, partial [Candidatus Pelagibacter sp.]|nr:glycosyl transferase [Candidatus Pelagibacter sp.]
MIKKNVIISLADSNYFELLNELVDSIKRFKQSETTAICILDGGLTDEQKKILTSKVDEIKSSEWDIKISQFKTMGKKWLKSLITRAFLTEYFPNYEKYLWIDADAWVNSWETIELYFKGCENNKLCISTNADRAYGGTRVNWFLGSFARIKSQNYKHAKASGFSEKIAREVAFKPHLNAGVFSLAANAPHWKMWRKNLEFSLKSGKVWGSDQIALNITIYHD